MLEGKVALVTGGAGDIGNEMAVHLAQAGASVVIWDMKSEEQAHASLERVRAIGRTTHYASVDIRNRLAVDAAMDDIFRQFSTLDIVCANAGVGETALFLDASQENWQKHIDVNLTGSFNVGQAAARRMVSHRIQGRIIFTSSWVAQIPWPEITAYAVSKAGVNMLAKQMARELAAHGIRVNVIAPGIVAAGMAGKLLVDDPAYRARASRVIPLGEPGTPVELAQAIVYLASPQSAYMTGAVLLIDGGCSLFQFDQ